MSFEEGRPPDPGAMAQAEAAFRAAMQAAPTEVWIDAEKTYQAGRPIRVGTCTCGHRFGISGHDGDARQVCRSCHRIVEFRCRGA